MKRKIQVTAAVCAALTALGFTGCIPGGALPNSAANAKTDFISTVSGDSDEAANQSPAHSDLYTPAGEFPIVKEPIRLIIFAPADGQFSRDQNGLTKELEEATNIDIIWRIASSGAFNEKMNLMFASGEMADVVATGPRSEDRISKAEEIHLGAQGFIIPLEKMIDSISQGYQDAFDKLPGLREYITTPEGHIYTLPNVDGSLHIQFNNKLWINTKWLERLGLDMPATTEDLYHVLKAFQEQDANGNGNNEDEIPLSTCMTGTGVEIDGFLMNPFQLTPESKLYLENGKVVFPPVTDGYKEGLAYIRNLYDEGLISLDSFTQSKETQIKINESGDAPVIGSFLAQRPGYACDLTIYPDNSRRWEEYQSVPPLIGPSGTAKSAWNPYAMYQTGVWAITSACQYPEAAFRLADWLSTEEGTLRSAEGPENIGWRYAEEGELGINGEQALIVQLPETKPENSGWGQLCGLVRTPELAAGYAAPQDPYSEDVPPLQGRNVILYHASLEHQAAAQSFESVLPDLYYSEEQIEAFSILKTTVLDYAKESAEAFITGTKSIELEWDKYLRQIESIGLSDYLSMIQEAYDSSPFSK